jgi:putative transposase
MSNESIKFNLRGAKLYWVLKDFMNVKETLVSNATNLAFGMVNLALALHHRWRPAQPDSSVLDVKAHCRGFTYVAKIALLGAVNATL